jgi:lipoate-protein ligase A
VALPAVRVWSYNAPAVVLGRAQRPDEAMLSRARGAGVAVVERPTGGGAVLAGPWLLGASVVLPPDHPRVTPSIPASYGWLSRAHAAWLRAAGIIAEPAPRPRDAGELGWACFAGQSHGELLVAGRKLVGLAQARRRAGVLFSAGTLLAAPPWDLLCEVMGQPPEQARALAEATISLAELGGSPPDDLLDVLAAALA